MEGEKKKKKSENLVVQEKNEGKIREFSWKSGISNVISKLVNFNHET